MAKKPEDVNRGMSAYLKSQYAWGPQLPSSFKLAKAKLDHVSLELEVDYDQTPEPWDNDWGRRPTNMRCYCLSVQAKAIVKGQELEGTVYLGGNWDTSDDPAYWIKNEVHGYLDGMASEALDELLKQIHYVSPPHDQLAPNRCEVEIELAQDKLSWWAKANHLEQGRIYGQCQKDAQGYYFYEPAA